MMFQTEIKPASIPVSFSTPAQSSLLQRKCPGCSTHSNDGELDDDQKRHQNLQRRAANEAELPDVPPMVHDVLRSPGEPLDREARAFMEPRFGHDFSRVRVHADSKAAESARAVNAYAYTVGQDVVFGAGQYAPGTSEGRRLLAHELAHVLQKSEGTRLEKYSVSSADDASEHEATAVEQKIANSSSSVSTTGKSPPSTLSRLPFGIKLPSGIRGLDAAEETILRPVFGSSLNYSQIYLSDGVGKDGRPFTVAEPLTGRQVINIGSAAYKTPGSNPRLLIHESTHCWQSQHHSDRTAFMTNSVESQAAASLAGGTSYCYIPGKSFDSYAAEQIARQVEKNEAPIVAHVSSVSAGAVDPENVKSLKIPRWETPGKPGVLC